LFQEVCGNNNKLESEKNIMKFRLSITFLFVALIASSVSAITSYNWSSSGVSDWDDNDGRNWVDELGNLVDKPNGQYEVRIKSPGLVARLDTVEGAWSTTGAGTRMRIYDGATLNIVDGGDLRGFGWIRIGDATGTKGQIGILNQSGGQILLRKLKESGKLCIGDGAGIIQGSTYTISGGILTYDVADPTCAGQLMVGSRDGQGSFVVVGTAPVIQMKNLYVAGETGYNSTIGTLEFRVGSNGVSSINLAGTAYLDQGTNTVANLVVGLTAAPLTGRDIVLVNANSRIQGVFDSLNGGSAAEGALVSLGFGGVNYNYALTYAGGSNNNNSIALLCVPEPATVILLALGGLLSIRKKS
jgi:hypothetical protein